jgi:hypothetical protein
MELLIVGALSAVGGVLADRYARPFIGRILEKARVWLVWKLTGTKAE